ncbi:MAG TPA: HTH domain-containing protein, partial [Rubrobacter sp.]|nr:HTH domain-containing protein [Rubrobacter sp.]
MYGYRPTTRLLSMLELLQARGRVGGPELARRLEVGERTVRRYVAMLQEMGVPVEAERGRYGAYTLRPGFKLPPMMFTDEEALALALGLLSARRLGLSGAAPAVEGARAKLERVMPEELRGRVRTFEEVVVPAAAAPARLPAGEVVVTLSEAVRERKRVWMRYRAGDAGETRRVVDPYAVVQGDAFWYTFGYC